MLDAAACHRAVESRDARFDGTFFVGITTTSIYCRPICPARVSYPDRRRFFDSAGAAEGAGFRPCLRCRPELAPGLALVDTVSRLARAAALRIAGGALNGSSVSALAREFHVSERHLRRAMESEIGLSPISLAQTHRLLLAKQLLGETALPVTHIAYASGFQSLRRFNTVFRAQYGLNPSAVRRARTSNTSSAAATGATNDVVRLSLAYRAPFAWDSLISLLKREAVPGVESVDDTRYARTMQIAGCSGTIVVDNGVSDDRKSKHAARTHLSVALSPTLVPALMPLLARLRQLFDLDSEPLVVDAHLAAAGLRSFVRRRPGLRVPGAIDGFEIALRTLTGAAARSPEERVKRIARVVESIGDQIDSGNPDLNRLMPTAPQIADAGERGLTSLGVSSRSARALLAVANAVIAGELTLDPTADPLATHRALLAIDGISDRAARTIVMRALHGPDDFPIADRPLNDRAEQWRPWRAYAALHLFS